MYSYLVIMIVIAAAGGSVGRWLPFPAGEGEP